MKQTKYQYYHIVTDSADYNVDTLEEAEEIYEELKEEGYGHLRLYGVISHEKKGAIIEDYIKGEEDNNPDETEEERLRFHDEPGSKEEDR
jgi:hypothetical protein